MLQLQGHSELIYFESISSTFLLEHLCKNRKLFQHVLQPPYTTAISIIYFEPQYSRYVGNIVEEKSECCLGLRDPLCHLFSSCFTLGLRMVAFQVFQAEQLCHVSVTAQGCIY